MTSHIETPALDPEPAVPATFSRPTVEGVIRSELGFTGLVISDSMSMDAIEGVPGGDATVRAFAAGHDIVLDPPDPVAAHGALVAAVERGEIARSRLDESVARLLRAKARLGLHVRRTVDLDEVMASVGARAHQALAREVSRRSITLVKDEREDVPLRLSRDARILYLSVLDHPSGWLIGAPSRTFIPELKARWPNVTAVELSDRTTTAEIDLVRNMAPLHDAVVASVFVRVASASGRMDLPSALAAFLSGLARSTQASGRPFVAVLFGNPYTATFLPELPTMLVTYDFYDLAEESAVRALAGEAPIGGRLPIALPGVAPLGHGLERAAAAPIEAR